MPKDYIPANDHEFLTWSQNFLAVATEFPEQTGLTPVQLDEIANDISNFVNDLGTSDTKRNESVAATHQKDVSRTLTEKRLRWSVDRVQSSPTMTDTVRIGLDITVPATERTTRTPQTPERLFAELQTDGKVHLEWDAGGNIYGTTYIIERKSGTDPNAEFIMVGTSTRRSFVYAGADAAHVSKYRVKAQRGTIVSDPSNSFTIDSE